jgi:hypothetical protein
MRKSVSIRSGRSEASNVKASPRVVAREALVAGRSEGAAAGLGHVGFVVDDEYSRHDDLGCKAS